MKDVHSDTYLAGAHVRKRHDSVIHFWSMASVMNLLCRRQFASLFVLLIAVFTSDSDIFDYVNPWICRNKFLFVNIK